MMLATAATHVVGEIGYGYEPTMEVAEYGIRIEYDPNAADVGEYNAQTRTIKIRHTGRAYIRSTATFQLGYAVLSRPTLAEVVKFAAARLILNDDLEALASATSDQRLWARALNVREFLLAAHVQLRAGLPVTL